MSWHFWIALDLKSILRRTLYHLHIVFSSTLGIFITPQIYLDIASKIFVHLISDLLFVTFVAHGSQSSKEISRFGMHVTVDRKQLLIPKCRKQLADRGLPTAARETSVSTKILPHYHGTIQWPLAIIGPPLPTNIKNRSKVRNI